MGRNCLHKKKSICVVWWDVVELDVRKVSKHDKVRQAKVRELILGTVGERRVSDAQALVDRAQQLSADLEGGRGHDQRSDGECEWGSITMLISSTNKNRTSLSRSTVVLWSGESRSGVVNIVLTLAPKA